ncbi:hypothetical protein Pelo_4547 [Pelomyxa schiedti]|nr:hypothetical protein Pelo_4547 [Pelomyxa schiedti]
MVNGVTLPEKIIPLASKILSGTPCFTQLICLLNSYNVTQFQNVCKTQSPIVNLPLFTKDAVVHDGMPLPERTYSSSQVLLHKTETCKLLQQPVSHICSIQWDNAGPLMMCTQSQDRRHHTWSSMGSSGKNC